MNYEVLTRIRPGDELKHIGSVEAPSEKLARNYAKTTYDEEDWSYMVLVERGDLVKVTGTDSDAVSKGELL